MVRPDDSFCLDYYRISTKNQTLGWLLIADNNSKYDFAKGNNGVLRLKNQSWMVCGLTGHPNIKSFYSSIFPGRSRKSEPKRQSSFPQT